MSQTATAAPTGMGNENTMSFVAYILTWITGLIVLLTSPKTAKTQRWHAIQAIGMGVAFTIIYVLLSIILTPMILTGSAAMAGLLGMISMVVWLGFVVLWIVMMVTAFQGKKIRLPIIAGIADKNA